MPLDGPDAQEPFAEDEPQGEAPAESPPDDQEAERPAFTMPESIPADQFPPMQEQFIPPEVIESAEPEEETEPVFEFPPEFRNRFDGLLFVGKLTDTVYVAGHEIVIRTLTNDEIMEVGLVTEKWSGTESAVTAYVTGIAGACMVSLDKRALPLPIHTDDTEVLVRFNYARGLSPFVTDKVYDRYRALEAKVEQMLAAMGGAHG